jgi:hypothetical protein
MAERISRRPEKEPELRPQDPRGIKRKLSHEMEGEPAPEQAKRVFEEVDREVSGEYEREQEQRVAGLNRRASGGRRKPRP